MTEVKKAAEHPMAKLGMQVFQALLIAACISTYTTISSSLKTIEGALNTLNTESALQKQRIDSLERNSSTQAAQIQALSTESQRQGYDIDSLKALPPRKEVTSRDKSYR